MTQNSSKIQRGLWLAAFLVTLMGALYFRTYPLRSEWLVSEKVFSRKADSHVRDQMRKQLESRFASASPQLTENVREKLVNQRLEAMIKEDPAAFETMRRHLSEEMGRQYKARYSFRYLSEADPYYYFNLTQNVIASGKLGSYIAGGRFLNPLRHAPLGNPDVINLHPYVGAGVYFVLKIFRSGLTLMQATGLTPLFLVTAAVASYFLLFPTLGLRVFSFWLAAQVFFLSPIVIQRSTLGWYDTDPYNLIFPVLITLTFLKALQARSRVIPLALIGGFLTGLYPFFWQGWTYMLALIPAAALVIGLFFAFRDRSFKRGSILVYAFLYTVTSLGFAVLFMTPSGFWDTVLSSVFYSSRVQGSSGELWPNLFVLVGETGSITFKKWVYLTSHYGVIFLAGLGMIIPLIRRKITPVWSAIVLMAAPLFIFSFVAERFSILAVFPLSLLAGYGIEGILDSAQTLGDDLRKKRQWAGAVVRGAALIAVTLAVMPRTLLGAHVSGFNSHFIMNDTWFEALSELGQKAPKDSIVHTWWPPGYFVNAISGLRTVIDGGSQHFPENFWMAKAFMARDEKTAAGLFRMMASGGNQAMAFLETKDIRGDQAVELILKIVILPRDQAMNLLPMTWSIKDKLALLDLSHGKKNHAPSYALIYEDMLTQNLAMQVIDAWSFDRAKQVFMEAPKKKGLKELLAGRGAADYTQKMLKVTGRGLPYEAPAAVAARRGTEIVFKNGVSFDLKSGYAFLKGAEGALPIRSLFKRDGVWSAVVPPVGNTAIAALIIPEGETFACVIAHSDLVMSIMFKLAYLGGQGLTQFKSVIRRGSTLGSDYVYIYRIDWD